MAGRGPRMTEFEERDYYSAPGRRSEVDFAEFDRRNRVMTRSPPPMREPRTPAFLRDEPRRSEAGPMVLRQRDVETFDRHHRSPSPVRVREQRLVRRPRSVSPPRHHHHHDVDEHTRSRTRFIERERERERCRSPSVERKRSPSPLPIRYVDRPRSPSPERERQRIRTRIVDRQRESSSSSSSSEEEQPPQRIRGPTIEREVITHYRDIDHGTIKAKPPTPPPAPRPRQRERVNERETDIDISLSKNRTEVDIYRSSGGRARSRSRVRNDDSLIVHSDSRRRAHSAAPVYSPGLDEEGQEYISKIDARGRMGEAWHGATRDWEIVDVPPGTERVRMDGVGGGSTETQWSKYSGVRRTKFIPERDAMPAPAPAPRAPSREPRKSSNNLWDREREIDINIDIDRSVERRYAEPPPPPAPAKDMWTEISKDLVVKEAIQQMGYEFEETPMFFYVMSYLKYDDVLQLVELTEDIKRFRKDRVREIAWERDWKDDWDRRHRHPHHHHHHHHPWDNERVREREVIYDNRRSRHF